MNGCRNTVTQYVPTKYSVKEVKSRCGSTGIHGQELVCEKCLAVAGRQYPQGWRDTPGDVCKHGTYIGDAWGPDYLCPYCEAE